MKCRRRAVGVQHDGSEIDPLAHQNVLRRSSEVGSCGSFSYLEDGIRRLRIRRREHRGVASSIVARADRQKLGSLAGPNRAR